MGLLQSFFKSSNKFLTSRKSSVGKVSANADALMIDRFSLSRIESLFESSKSSKGGQRRDSSLRSSLRSSLQSQTRLTLASRLKGCASSLPYVQVAERPLSSVSAFGASATCRALRACLLTVPADFLQGQALQKAVFHRRAKEETPASAWVLPSPSYPARPTLSRRIFVFPVGSMMLL